MAEHKAGPAIVGFTYDRGFDGGGVEGVVHVLADGPGGIATHATEEHGTAQGTEGIGAVVFRAAGAQAAGDGGDEVAEFGGGGGKVGIPFGEKVGDAEGFDGIILGDEGEHGGLEGIAYGGVLNFEEGGGGFSVLGIVGGDGVDDESAEGIAGGRGRIGDGGMPGAGGQEEGHEQGKYDAIGM